MGKIKILFKKNSGLFILLVFALLTRFWSLSEPSEVVFDEVHFGKYASAYFNGEYYFALHPPLGPLLIAGFAKIAGYDLKGEKPEKIFDHIGGKFDSKNFFILRFMPAIAGTLLVLLVYQMILLFGLSKKSAFLAGFLVLFDNGFLVQSKFIALDSFLLLFGFSALYFFFLSKKRNNFLFLSLSALFATLALAVKWTAATFFLIILLLIFVDFIKDRKLKQLVQKVAIFAVIPFAAYITIFAVHLKLLPKSGWGDAYMSQEFQKTLAGNKLAGNVKPLPFWKKIVELNSAIWRYNYAGLKGVEHPYSSKWYQWPLDKKALWYWNKNEKDTAANIYLLGNPLVWLLVLVGVIFSVFGLVIKKIRKKEINPLIYLFLLGYFANLLPYVFVERTTFIYHYLPSLIFGILILALLFEQIKIPRALYVVSLIIVASVFLLLSPLNYGFPLSPEINNFYNIFLKFLR